jgi:hypothetical protein
MNGDDAGTDVVAQLQQAASDWLGATADAPAPGAAPSGAITAVLVTNVTPPIDLSGQGGGGGVGGALLKWIQPTISGSLPIIGPVNVAPYGAASPAVGTAVFYSVLALAGFGLYTLIFRR